MWGRKLPSQEEEPDPVCLESFWLTERSIWFWLSKMDVERGRHSSRGFSSPLVIWEKESNPV